MAKQSGLPALTEKEFEHQVKALAKLLGWKYYHTWRSIHSPAGFPDCCMVKPPRLIYSELKSEKGIVSPEQQAWLDILGQCPQVEVYLWRPDQLQEIADILQGKT